MSSTHSNAQSTRQHTSSRKRAPKACISCRSRKVRCDVFFGGTPCTNCSLDGLGCVVVGRALRLRRSDKGQLAPAQNQSDQPEGLETTSFLSAETGQPSKSTIEHSYGDASVSDGVGEMIDDNTTTEATQTCQSADNTNVSNSMASHKPNAFVRNADPSPRVDMGNKDYSNISLPSHCSSRAGQLTRITGTIFNSDVPYSCFRFLTVSQMHRMPPECVHLLEVQGCFRVPIGPILDVFLREYFLHVHPLLPIINEGDFWDVYSYDPEENNGAPEPINHAIPLVVFQAMMLASCSFVPLETIRCLGFSNAREARRAFYQRARLLFHLQSESVPLHLSQAALLLSYWSPSFREAATKQNTNWLRIAIEQAENAGAHERTSLSRSSNMTSHAELREHNLLRRLWCCCLVRDRILSFCLRRNVQISRAHFDMDEFMIFSTTDMQDELNRSKVYSPKVKRHLIEVFAQLAGMCRLMTDAGSLVFPFDKGSEWDKLAGAEDIARVRKTKVALRQWYIEALSKLLLPLKSDMHHSANHQEFHDAVTLFTRLVFIYYHSSIVAICHFQMLQSAIESIVTPAIFETASLNSHVEELRDAAFRVTECFEKLSQHKLHRFLPTTAIACTALPLVLHTLGARLSSTAPDCKLDILNQLMTTYESQYDGVEWVGETVKHILESSDKSSMRLHGTGMPAFAPLSRSCMDTLISQPCFYLQVAMTMDLSLSKGRLPGAADFPARLRQFFSRSRNPHHGAKSQQSADIYEHRGWRDDGLGKVTSFHMLGGAASKPWPEKVSSLDNVSGQPYLKPGRGFPNANGSTTENDVRLFSESNRPPPDNSLLEWFQLPEDTPDIPFQNSCASDADDLTGDFASEPGTGQCDIREEDSDMQLLLSWLSHDEEDERMSPLT